MGNSKAYTEKMKAFIETAIADGELEEKEIAFLRRKAEELGDDPDEVEMTAKAEMAYLLKEEKKKKSSKHGDLRKCSSCGAPVESFSVVCAECGHEFSNVEAPQSISELSKVLQDIAKGVRQEKENLAVDKWNAHLKNPLNIAKEMNDLQSSVISTFPVPTTKEDILEFLSVAVGEAMKKPNKVGPYVMDGSDGIVNAWKSKAEQVITKAEFVLGDDVKLMESFSNIRQQLGSVKGKKKGLFSKFF